MAVRILFWLEFEVVVSLRCQSQIDGGARPRTGCSQGWCSGKGRGVGFGKRGGIGGGLIFCLKTDFKEFGSGAGAGWQIKTASSVSVALDAGGIVGSFCLPPPLLSWFRT